MKDDKAKGYCENNNTNDYNRRARCTDVKITYSDILFSWLQNFAILVANSSKYVLQFYWIFFYVYFKLMEINSVQAID